MVGLVDVRRQELDAHRGRKHVGEQGFSLVDCVLVAFTHELDQSRLASDELHAVDVVIDHLFHVLNLGLQQRLALCRLAVL